MSDEIRGVLMLPVVIVSVVAWVVYGVVRGGER